MSAKISPRKTPLFKNIKAILKYYDCLPECGANCCKIQPIEIDDADRNVLHKISKEKVINLDEFVSQGQKFYRMSYPCTFLSESNKCSVYNHRPTPCRIYPFSVYEESFNLGIYPCYVGVSICNDFFDYLRKTGTYVSDETIENMLSAKKLLYSDVEGNPDLDLVGIPFSEISNFKKYLHEKYQ